MPRDKSPGPDRSIRLPQLRLPPGAWDTHVHIFGPQTRFPLSENRNLDLEDCSFDDLVALHDRLGIAHALLVQSFHHGYSYEYMLHALSRAPQRFRGVTMLAPDATDTELAILDKAGVIGSRFAYRASPQLDTRMIARIQEFGWQSHFMLHGEEESAAWASHILATPGRFVIEHGGWPPAERGLDSSAFRLVLDCLDTGRCWVKLSPRFSKQKTIPFSDVAPFIQALVARAPTRLLWGSDWPHPNYFNPMPHDADLVDLMLDWVPDEAIRRLIFVDNPSQLFRSAR